MSVNSRCGGQWVQKMNKDDKRTESQDKRIIQRQAAVGNHPKHISVSDGNKS